MPEQMDPVASQQPTATVATPKNSINWKNILIGIILGAILVGIVGFTFWYFTRPKEPEPSSVTTTKTSTSSAKTATSSAKKDDTSGWRVYTNKNLGFALKYPQDWKDPTETVLSTSTNVEFQAEGFRITINVGAHYNQFLNRDFTFDEWVNRLTAGNVTSERKVGGKKAVRTEYITSVGEKEIDTFIASGKTIFTISANYDPKQEKEILPIFNQILSTFKFLD